MRKALPLLFLSLSLSLSLHATRSLLRPYIIRQPDGTTLTVTRHLVSTGGDRFVYYTTNDGLPLLRHTEGGYYYATLDADGQPCATSCLAHETAQRSSIEAEVATGLRAHASRIHDAFVRTSEATATPLRSRALTTKDGITPYGEPAGGILPSIGTPVIPVIMVQFPDLAFADTTTVDKVTRWLNDPEYADEPYCKGGAAAWFTDQSLGLFAPRFEVVATVTAKNGYAYYGANSPSGSIDLKCTELVSEAIQSAVSKGVDFSKYKNETMDQVPLVSIYHAGPGEHSSYETGCEDYLWAHFRASTFTANGDTRIRSYFVGNETIRSYKLGDDGMPVPTGSHTDGIGVFVHELGHALGLPDFYYTGSNAVIKDTLQTPYYWSVMDYGQYAYDGYRPVGYSAYERAMLGWQRVTEIADDGLYTLLPYDADITDPNTEATAYCLRSSTNPSEYFFLENRRIGKWYPSFMGEGMLITHIDFANSAWSANNLNNDPSHQRYEIVPADGVKSPLGEDGRLSWKLVRADLWGNATEPQDFTDETIPGSLLSDGSPLGKPIYGIKVEADGNVTFALGDRSLTGIDCPALPAINAGTAVYYRMDGRRVSGRPATGIYVVRDAQGHSSKVYIK